MFTESLTASSIITIPKFEPKHVANRSWL